MNDNKNNNDITKLTAVGFCLLIAYIVSLCFFPQGTQVGTGLNTYTGFTASEVERYNTILIVDSVISVIGFAIAMFSLKGSNKIKDENIKKKKNKEFATLMAIALFMVIITICNVVSWNS